MKRVGRNPLMSGAFGVRLSKDGTERLSYYPSQSPNERGVRCENVFKLIPLMEQDKSRNPLMSGAFGVSAPGTYVGRQYTGMSQSPNERGVRCEITNANF